MSLTRRLRIILGLLLWMKLLFLVFVSPRPVNPAETSALRLLSEDKLVKPFNIKEFDDGDRLGICGITVKVTTELSSFPDEGTTIAEEQESAEACVAELAALGINKILLITHIGYENDLDLLTSIDGVDVVIGGHSHSLLAGTEFTQFGFPVSGSYPTMVGSVCVATAWEYTRVVGSLLSIMAPRILRYCS